LRNSKIEEKNRKKSIQDKVGEWVNSFFEKHPFLRVNIYHRFQKYRFKFYAWRNLKSEKYYSEICPFKIVWVDPAKIKYHTYGRDYMDIFLHETRLFNNWKDVGLIKGGDWDLKKIRISDLEFYKSLEKHFLEGVRWEETSFFKTVVKNLNQGVALFDGCLTTEDYLKKCKLLDLLYKDMKDNGYRSQKEIYRKKYDLNYLSGRLNRELLDEVTVNIDRNGDLLLFDGRHRLAMAQILGISEIPVRILVRHERWQRKKDALYRYIDKQMGGRAYNELLHPDLKDVPTHYDTVSRFELIRNNMSVDKGMVLEIGSLDGYFSQRLEEEGFKCSVLVYESRKIKFLKLFKRYNRDDFQIFDQTLDKDTMPREGFDIVIALNTFHPSEKKAIDCFIELLKDLEVKEMFFQWKRDDVISLQVTHTHSSEREILDEILKSCFVNYDAFDMPKKPNEKVYRFYR